MGRRTINKEHRWWGVLPGPQATPYVVLLRVRVRKKEPRKYSERGRDSGCVCVPVSTDAQSVNFGSHPRGRAPPSHSHGKITHVRGHVRASVRPSSVRSLVPLLPRVLVSFLESFTMGKGLSAWRKFRRKRVENGEEGGKKNRTSNYSPSLFRFHG